MNRADLQQVAETRLADAEALLRNACYAGAYYLVGYAAECALKACIAKQTRAFDFPDKNFAQKCYTHKLHDLLSLAGLNQQLELDAAEKPDLMRNWTVVKDWEENSRYRTDIGEQRARDLIESLRTGESGVLRWLRTYW